MGLDRIARRIRPADPLRTTRLREDVKRLKAVELAVIDDPTVRQSNIKHAAESWPQPRGERRASSKAGKPGTSAFRGPKR